MKDVLPAATTFFNLLHPVNGDGFAVYSGSMDVTFAGIVKDSKFQDLSQAEQRLFIYIFFNVRYHSFTSQLFPGFDILSSISS